MMLMTPPSASEPYATDEGPLTTSIRSTWAGSTSDVWGPLPRVLFIGQPSTSTSTRWPVSPRMDGRCSQGLSLLLSTPGSAASTSPSTSGACSRSTWRETKDSACGDSK